MSVFVDTNVLIRHQTGDPPELAVWATAYLATGTDPLLTDLVAAATVYVLESFYKKPRAQVAEAMRSLLAFELVVCVDPPPLLPAVEVFEAERIDFAEAYPVACAESTDVRKIASFDRSPDRVRTVSRVNPTPVG